MLTLELVKLKYQKYIKKKEKFSIINCNVSEPDVDHEPLKIKNRGLDLFLIGQIVKGKGQMDAIKAVHILFNEVVSQLNLLVIGPKYQIMTLLLRNCRTT